jgi:hypothetical protein
MLHNILQNIHCRNAYRGRTKSHRSTFGKCEVDRSAARVPSAPQGLAFLIIGIQQLSSQSAAKRIHRWKHLLWLQMWLATGI